MTLLMLMLMLMLMLKQRTISQQMMLRMMREERAARLKLFATEQC